MYINRHQMEAGRNVRLINTTDKPINNVMWIDLAANSSVGVTWTQWLMLQADEGVDQMLEDKVIEVEYCD